MAKIALVSGVTCHSDAHDHLRFFKRLLSKALVNFMHCVGFLVFRSKYIGGDFLEANICFKADSLN